MKKRNKKKVEALLQIIEGDIERTRKALKDKRYPFASMGAHNIETDAKEIQEITRRG